ncbi:LysR family transcriptional regulator [Roseinatronobacter alkalisoli]|uniref:LysR family transcriptional regulator n=1 Tax=Roseinatronobacter alkalisoli TaxID=3028235 RepID=A0ABT5TDD5_9RHOB|nr:LysR family transcriptional regulator [Roseinatronobacter sp. HJB301]MDD7972994.1 LysR family transcriptional regulator [Roseinatronobacter sp. HJB301]
MTNISGFDLNLLRVLDALLREGSTVGAGRKLGLSQPAVSAALGRLRHALGDPLFVRQGQGLVPTSYATALEGPLKEVLQDLERVLAGAHRFDPARAKLDFRISGTDFFATMLMPELGARLQSEAPGVRLQLVDLVPDHYAEALERQNVALALLPEHPFPAWIAHEPLFRAEFTVIARHDHPALATAGIAPGDSIPIDLFCALGHVLCSPDGRFQGLGDAALEREGRARRVVMSVPVFEGVLQVVATSDFIALFPRDLAEHRAQSAGISLYSPPVTIIPPQICMIWHLRHTADPAHVWLRGIVRDILAPLGRYSTRAP